MPAPCSGGSAGCGGTAPLTCPRRVAEVVPAATGPAARARGCHTGALQLVPGGMDDRGARRVLLVLAASGAYVGVWALLAPSSFFTSFPGVGRQWLEGHGTYDEHLVRDVGGLYLALVVITAGAARYLDPAAVRLVGAGWLVFGVPHMHFHVVHLGTYDRVDQALNVATLGGTVVLAALLLLPRRRAREADATPAGRAPGRRSSR